MASSHFRVAGRLALLFSIAGRQMVNNCWYMFAGVATNVGYMRHATSSTTTITMIDKTANVVTNSPQILLLDDDCYD